MKNLPILLLSVCWSLGRVNGVHPECRFQLEIHKEEARCMELLKNAKPVDYKEKLQAGDARISSKNKSEENPKDLEQSLSLAVAESKVLVAGMTSGFPRQLFQTEDQIHNSLLWSHAKEKLDSSVTFKKP
ncbi:hypothetical protein Q9966_011739 [Columba livia]|nr:hypothetical protein Q9966_011739 [Columba livia]